MLPQLIQSQLKAIISCLFSDTRELNAMRAKTVSNISRVSLTPGMVSDCMASICFGRTEGKTEGERKKGKK